MSQAFYRKWRPHLWDEVVSQEHIVHTLQNAIRSGRFGHAYLFAGPRGTGKTSTARLLAKAVNCLAEDQAERPCDHCDHCSAVNEGRFLDLIEIDAASNTSVEDVRDLRDKINFTPSQGRYKVYIIDEVHMLSTAAFNALLKTLEEPPAHAIFVLATTEVHKIPATVLSRCQRHEFRRIPVQDIARHLQHIAEGEKLEVEPEVLTLIARQSTGAMRDAISLLDQLASTGQKITLVQAQEVLGTATNQAVIDLVKHILDQNPGEGFSIIHQALDSGTDARQFARQMVEYLRSLLLVRLGNANQVDATAEIRAQMVQHAQAFEMDHLLEIIRLFNNAATDTKGGWQPGLPLELAIADAVEIPHRTAQAAAPPPIDVAPPTRPTRTPAAPLEPPDWPNADLTPALPAQSEPVQKKSPPASPMPTPLQAEEETDTPKSAPEAISVQDIHQNWRRIRALVKRKNIATEALLNSCKLLGIKDGLLVLGFQAELLRTKMSSEENLDIFSSAIGEVLGIKPGITCVVMSSKAGTAPADMNIESDGMVGTALNLGGQIVHKE
jgi:DNA polymerase III subunit gamma/tau